MVPPSLSLSLITRQLLLTEENSNHLMGNHCTHKKRGRGEERRERGRGEEWRERGSKRKTDREEGGKERERERGRIRHSPG